MIFELCICNQRRFRHDDDASKEPGHLQVIKFYMKSAIESDPAPVLEECNEICGGEADFMQEHTENEFIILSQHTSRYLRCEADIKQN